MCHHVHVHVTLSAEDKAAAKKLSGIMIPVYASIALAAIALVALTAAPPRQGDMIATASAPAATR